MKVNKITMSIVKTLSLPKCDYTDKKNFDFKNKGCAIVNVNVDCFPILCEECICSQEYRDNLRIYIKQQKAKG